MGKDELADLLALVRALLDERAVVSEQVLGEELVEFVPRCILILVNLYCKLLAEHESVCETAIDR